MRTVIKISLLLQVGILRDYPVNGISRMKDRRVLFREALHEFNRTFKLAVLIIY